jgi:phage terminase large subunit-like protein
MARNGKSPRPDHPVERYGRRIVQGEIVCCKWVRLFVERHFRDLRTGAARALHCDVSAGERVLRFFALLKHSKGEWAGKRFDLDDWQKFYLFVLFGWKRADGTRRFRTAYTEIARKNGKSTLAAGVALYLFVGDDEPGAEVYCVATKRDQAKIVWSEIARMVQSSSGFRKAIKTVKDNLSCEGKHAKCEPLGSDADTLDGLNLNGAIVDELHAHKSRGVWDVITTATGSRRQPLIYAITTAGFDRQSVCFQQHEYTEKVLEGVIEDDAFFGFIASLDAGDDWQNPALWVKANPNLGVSVKLESLQEQCLKAQHDPASQNAFLRLRLNQWTSNEIRWVTYEVWDQNAGSVDESLLEGRTCYGGLDLASTTDTASFVLAFTPLEPGGPVILLPRFWIPSENMHLRVLRDRVPYDAWVRDGWMSATPGNVIDYDAIRKQIVSDYSRFAIRQIRFDRWGATQLSTQLAADDGLEMVTMGQGFASMSSPMKEFMRRLQDQSIAHGGHPVLRWQASNVMARMDPAGNIKPDKAASRERIDGIVAAIMSLDGVIREPDSVYELDGIKIL